MSEKAKNLSIEETTQRILHRLLEFSQSLLKGDYSRRIIVDVDDTLVSKICSNFNQYADRLQVNPPGGAEEIEASVNNFIEVISSFANRDFSTKLSISENGNMLDAIATGINVLGEELEQTTVSKNELEIERNELKVAKEKAEESNRLKTVFLGNLSHEIRTPLQAISGFAEVLESPRLTEEKKRQYLDIIKRRANDLQNVIDSLLDLASLETGEIKAYPSHINLAEHIKSIFSSLQQDLELRQKPLRLVLLNELPENSPLYVDALHLKQVVVNIVRNGIKFTNEGHVTLHCKKETDRYVLTVSDSGIGIPPEKLEHIFEPFRQAHEGLSRTKGGIGLGLSICSKMVALWGGSISVKSELGMGSQFSFTLPFSVNGP
jgi:signal transduction histidine kinase